MSSKMYVGNLSFSVTEDDLRSLFSEFGTPTEVILVMDRETNRPRGFGFVAMDTKEAMDAAIRGANGREFQGRALAVNEARERESRPAFGGGGSGGGGGRSGGNDRQGGRRW